MNRSCISLKNHIRPNLVCIFLTYEKPLNLIFFRILVILYSLQLLWFIPLLLLFIIMFQKFSYMSAIQSLYLDSKLNFYLCFITGILIEQFTIDYTYFLLTFLDETFNASIFDYSFLWFVSNIMLINIYMFSVRILVFCNLKFNKVISSASRFATQYLK